MSCSSTGVGVVGIAGDFYLIHRLPPHGNSTVCLNNRHCTSQVHVVFIVRADAVRAANGAGLRLPEPFHAKFRSSTSLLLGAPFLLVR